MKTYTNKQIADALRAALAVLADDCLCPFGTKKELYICWALHQAVRDRSLVTHIQETIIYPRLGWMSSLSPWLLSQGVPAKEVYADHGRHLQAHRKAWVKRLIKEFSK